VTKERRDVRPGEVLIDSIGRPMFAVVDVVRAKHPNYVILIGEKGKRAAGHRTSLVVVDIPDEGTRS
jgi:hypothetical protein